MHLVPAENVLQRAPNDIRKAATWGPNPRCSTKGLRCVGSQNWRNPLGDFAKKIHRNVFCDFQGPPKMGPLSFFRGTIPILQGILMGAVWELGVPCPWGSLEFPGRLGSLKVVQKKKVSSCRGFFFVALEAQKCLEFCSHSV